MDRRGGGGVARKRGRERGRDDRLVVDSCLSWDFCWIGFDFAFLRLAFSSSSRTRASKRRERLEGGAGDLSNWSDSDEGDLKVPEGVEGGGGTLRNEGGEMNGEE